jgi:uncharacterized protein YjcR
MVTDPLIRKLADWVKTNRATTLAEYLGYKTTNTVHSWIRKERIPGHARDRVAEFLNVRGKKG